MIKKRGTQYIPILNNKASLVQTVNNRTGAFFVLKYNNRSYELSSSLRSLWKCYLADQNKAILGPEPLIVFSRGENLKSILERDVRPHKKSIMRKCGACRWCRFISEGSYLCVFDFRYTIACPGMCNCNTKNLVYVASCTACEAFYVGKTIRRLRDRISEHVRSIRKKDIHNALYLHTTTCSNFKKFVFFVVDRVINFEKGIDLVNKVGMLESEWQLI